MVGINKKAVALIVIAFFFLILEKQVEVSGLRQLLILQHLKKVRQKRMILLQLMQRNSRRARRAWSWPRNQFWFENLLNGSFVEDWWKENFRIGGRRTSELQDVPLSLLSMWLVRRWRRKTPDCGNVSQCTSE